MALLTHNKRRTFMLSGHKTSISLENEFWVELEHLAKRQNISVSELITQIDAQRKISNLASCLRLYVLQSMKA